MNFLKILLSSLVFKFSNIFLYNFISSSLAKLFSMQSYIDISKLRINSKEDLETVEKILFTITAKAIVMRFKYDSKEKAREEYLKQIEYLKYVILKQ